MTRKSSASTHRAAAARQVAFARLLGGLAALFIAGAARADREELYTVIGYDPGVSRYELPVKGSGAATRFADAVDLSAYYGLTNTLHVGGRLRVTSDTNVHISNASVPLPDGSRPQGDVYLDHRALGLGALVLYRFDTRRSLAPVVELEAGFTAQRFTRIAFIPTNATFTYPQPSVSRTALYGSAALLVEYRFGNRWVAQAGIAALGERGGFMPWGLAVPLRVGFIW